jgi:transposase-like protein
VAKAGRKGRRRRLKGKRGRGTLAGEKPPVLGLLQRNGEVVIKMLPNVQQKTIQPVITSTVASGSQFYTDEITSTVVCPNGATDIKASITLLENMLGMKPVLSLSKGWRWIP